MKKQNKIVQKILLEDQDVSQERIAEKESSVLYIVITDFEVSELIIKIRRYVPIYHVFENLRKALSNVFETYDFKKTLTVSFKSRHFEHEIQDMFYLMIAEMKRAQVYRLKVMIDYGLDFLVLDERINYTNLESLSFNTHFSGRTLREFRIIVDSKDPIKLKEFEGNLSDIRSLIELLKSDTLIKMNIKLVEIKSNNIPICNSLKELKLTTQINSEGIRFKDHDIAQLISRFPNLKILNFNMEENHNV